MIPPLTELFIREVFSHQPFCAERVFMYEFVDNELVPADDESQRLLTRYRHAIQQIAHAPLQREQMWIGDLHLDGGSPRTGYCYGGCRVEGVVVVVARTIECPEGADRPEPLLDGYFLEAMCQRLAQILAAAPPPARSGKDVPGATHVDLIAQEIHSLEQYEVMWRQKYGNGKWLAVHDGRVIAIGETRQDVEDKVHRIAPKSPVLYLPPKGKEQVVDILGADDA